MHEFVALASLSIQLVWRCSDDGNCFFLAPQWATITGQPVEDGLGYRWLDVIHPDDRAACLAEWQACVRERPLRAKWAAEDRGEEFPPTLSGAVEMALTEWLEKHEPQALVPIPGVRGGRILPPPESPSARSRTP